MFIATLFAMAKTRKQLRYPLMYIWKKKLWYTQSALSIHVRYVPSPLSGTKFHGCSSLLKKMV